MTHETVSKACADVRKELQALKFWTPRMDEIEVAFVEYGRAAGWFWNGKITIIHKEATWLGELTSLLLGLTPKAEVMPNHCRDTVRHEYGHALWWAHENVFRDAPAFAIFGHGVAREDYISDYATTNSGEDFAETFAVYVRRKGVMTKAAKRSHILWLKWSALRSIPELLQRSRLL